MTVRYDRLNKEPLERRKKKMRNARDLTGTVVMSTLVISLLTLNSLFVIFDPTIFLDMGPRPSPSREETSVYHAAKQATGETYVRYSEYQYDPSFNRNLANNPGSPSPKPQHQTQGTIPHNDEFHELKAKYKSDNLSILSEGDENVDQNSRTKFEFEQSKSSKFVKGSLRSKVSFWKEIEADKFVLDTIQEGYKLPFLKIPENAEFRNNRSAETEKDFVSESIKELLESNRIKEVPFKPKIVNPLSVSSNKGKKRLILDLRYVNKHLQTQKFKFEDWKTFQNYLIKDGFLFKFDLKSGYHHVDIHNSHQTYLGFSWSVEGETKYFVFSVLPFGLSTAPFAFTKVCRPLVKLWRFHGIKIVIYLDDGFSIAETFPACMSNSNFVKSSLIRAGFIPNEEKSVWIPCQICEWLGIILNTREGALRLPEKRIVSLISSVNEAISSFPFVTARRLGQIAGKIISMSAVIGNVSRLMTRNIYRAIEARFDWDSPLYLCGNLEVLRELQFWFNNVNDLNIRKLFSHQPPSIISYSDASSVACGAFIVSCGELVAHKMWSEGEASMSSTWRELKAIQYALYSFVHFLKGQSVHWFTDNQGAVSIIKNGSPKQHLHEIALDLFSFCLLHCISIFPEWIPRDLNVTADKISKFIDWDDWCTTNDLFEYLNCKWGPFTVDRFASAENAKLQRFNSLFWNPGTEQVNAFSVSWENENNWLVPPVYLISSSIRHLLSCNAVGTLIAPCWPSAPFWPLVFLHSFQKQSYVKEFLILKNEGNLLKLGNFKGSLLGSKNFTGSVLAIKF